MQALEQKATLPSDGNFSEVLANWLTAFGEAFGQEVTAERMRIYKLALEPRLTAEELDASCASALSRCRFFPTIYELLAQREDTARAVDTLEAEKVWDEVQAYIRRWGADLTPVATGGKLIEPPPLDDVTAWAIRQCGGYGFLCRLPHERYHFVRESFIKHFNRYHETGGLKQLPGQAESRRLLKRYAPKLFEAKVEAPTE